MIPFNKNVIREVLELEGSRHVGNDLEMINEGDLENILDMAQKSILSPDYKGYLLYRCWKNKGDIKHVIEFDNGVKLSGGIDIDGNFLITISFYA